MPRNSADVYTLPPGYEAVTGSTVQASQHNEPLEDIAEAITGSLSRGGAAPMTGNLNLGGNKVTNLGSGTSAADGVTKEQLDLVSDALAALQSTVTALADFSGIPSGALVAFAMGATPVGWFACDGSAVSRTTYANLFAAIGTLYGAGDGSTTFNLPDYRGEFIRGLDLGRGVDPGRTIGTAQGDAIKSHDHGGSTGTAGNHRHIGGHGNAGSETTRYGMVDTGINALGASISYSTGWGRYTSTEPAHAHTIPAFGGAETRARNVSALICIKV